MGVDSDLVYGDQDAGVADAQLGQQLAALDVRQIGGGLPVEVQQVEHDVGHRYPGQQLRRRVQPEVRHPAHGVDHDDLAIQHHLAPRQCLAQSGRHLGEDQREVLGIARVNPNLAIGSYP